MNYALAHQDIIVKNMAALAKQKMMASALQGNGAGAPAGAAAPQDSNSAANEPVRALPSGNKPVLSPLQPNSAPA